MAFDAAAMAQAWPDWVIVKAYGDGDDPARCAEFKVIVDVPAITAALTAAYAAGVAACEARDLETLRRFNLAYHAPLDLTPRDLDGGAGGG